MWRGGALESWGHALLKHDLMAPRTSQSLVRFFLARNGTSVSVCCPGLPDPCPTCMAHEREHSRTKPRACPWLLALSHAHHAATTASFFYAIPARASNRAKQAIISPTWSTRRLQIRLLTCPGLIDNPINAHPRIIPRIILRLDDSGGHSIPVHSSCQLFFCLVMRLA